jgi:UDP-GlcNAc:undecaprenyl-phosphate/decaprenyl-phosphate GlcNAc-1-phosphate transferase
LFEKTGTNRCLFFYDLIFTNIVNIAIVVVASCAITAVVIWLILRTSLVTKFIDRTDKFHAMHQLPTPHIGGLAIMTTVLLVAVFMVNAALPKMLIAILAITIVLTIVSTWDDQKNLSTLFRLSVHLLAAAVFVIMLGAKLVDKLEHLQLDGSPNILHLLALIGLCSLFFVAAISWMTNLYNFMDGANGLAGFMGLIGFGALALSAQLTPILNSIDFVHLSIVCSAIAGACLGFLFFNFPQARVFMGDAGSIPLGFLAATLGMYGALIQAWAWWFPVLVFSPFIVDASATLAKRLWKRERVWEGHRQHYYHRLILVFGWSHTKTALAYAGLMLLVASTSLAVVTNENYQFPAILIATWVVIYLLLLTCLEWRFSVKNKKNSNCNKNKNV